MDHTEAIRSKATERYLLGELTGELREQYEEHFFSCPECAQDVATGAVFVDNARDALRARPSFEHISVRAQSGGGWLAQLLRPAVAVPVFAALLLVVAYQSAVTIPHLHSAISRASSPQALASFSLITQNTRGGEPLTVRVQPGQPFILYLDIPPVHPYPRYAFDVENDSGELEFSVPISAQQAANTVQLLIPGGRLSAGRHTAVLRGIEAGQSGSTSAQVAGYRFTVEFGR
jgi:hypothetical protein